MNKGAKSKNAGFLFSGKKFLDCLNFKPFTS